MGHNRSASKHYRAKTKSLECCHSSATVCDLWIIRSCYNERGHTECLLFICLQLKLAFSHQLVLLSTRMLICPVISQLTEKDSVLFHWICHRIFFKLPAIQLLCKDIYRMCCNWYWFSTVIFTWFAVMFVSTALSCASFSLRVYFRFLPFNRQFSPSLRYCLRGIVWSVKGVYACRDWPTREC